MIDDVTLDALAKTQQTLLALLAPLDEHTLRAQIHPELSALGWHLGHCAVVERLWVHDHLLGLDDPEAPSRALYLPEHSAKTTRGERLPDTEALKKWAEASFSESLRLLRSVRQPRRPDLLQDQFLPRFLMQHHAQHVETMRMALAQRRLECDRVPPAVTPCATEPTWATLPEGWHTVGMDHRAGFDNERPARQLRLGKARLARRPVTNAEYMAFVEDGGYRVRRYWCDGGWAWRRASGATHPEFWSDADARIEHTPQGPRALGPDAPVMGVSYYEAKAFATWAGARLPHEYEWEAAIRAGLLEGVGEAWEWCGNRFHPYPGFRPYPYKRYSVPWFDGGHFVLRGASRYSLNCIRRPSFRNFYTANQRHVFAGIRLAAD